MKLVATNPNKFKANAYAAYDFINNRRSVPLYQAGGVAPDPEMAPDAQPAQPDVQTLMQEFSQTQDPNIAIQILQMLAQPETAAQAVSMLMQAMQSQTTEAAPAEPGTEVPAAANGMSLDDLKLENSLFDRIYKEVTGKTLKK